MSTTSTASPASNSLKKYWTISEVCERLSVSDTFVYGLIAKRMLERVYLPSPRGKVRDGLQRITGESLDRYERGEVASPERAVKRRAAAARAKPPAPKPAAGGFAHFR